MNLSVPKRVTENTALTKIYLQRRILTKTSKKLQAYLWDLKDGDGKMTGY